MAMCNRLSDAELTLDLWAYFDCGGNQSEAARTRGLTRQTYNKRLRTARKRLGMTLGRADPEKRAGPSRRRRWSAIRERTVELLLEKKIDDDGNVVLTTDGRLVGLSYREILDVLAVEHPCTSTPRSRQAYVARVQDEMRDDADENGDLVYELPEYRPRASLPT